MIRRSETGCLVVLFALVLSLVIFVGIGACAETVFSFVTGQPWSRDRALIFAVGLFALGTFIRMVVR